MPSEKTAAFVFEPVHDDFLLRGATMQTPSRPRTSDATGIRGSMGGGAAQQEDFNPFRRSTEFVRFLAVFRVSIRAW